MGKSRWITVTFDPVPEERNPVLMIDGYIDTPTQRARLLGWLNEELAKGARVVEVALYDHLIRPIKKSAKASYALELLGAGR